MDKELSDLLDRARVATLEASLLARRPIEKFFGTTYAVAGFTFCAGVFYTGYLASNPTLTPLQASIWLVSLLLCIIALPLLFTLMMIDWRDFRAMYRIKARKELHDMSSIRAQWTTFKAFIWHNRS